MQFKLEIAEALAAIPLVNRKVVSDDKGRDEVQVSAEIEILQPTWGKKKKMNR